MTYSTRTIGIIVASILSMVFIVTAVLLSGPLPFHFQRVSAESTHDLLVSYAAKDTDGDGLPDWEEALYGTDPNNPRSVNADVTDSVAVSQGLVKPKFATATSTPIDARSVPGIDAGPKTITDQFARGLFSQYLAQHNSSTPPTPAEIANFVEGAVKDLQTSNQLPNPYNQGQVRVSGSGPDTLTAYAVSVDQVFAGITLRSGKSELDYFADAVEKNDKTGLPQVKKIGDGYAQFAKAYIALSVPKEAAVPHLAVANAAGRLSQDLHDMSAFDTDPLRAYLGLASYQRDVTDFVQSLASMYTVFVSEQVTIPDGAPGSSLYSVMRSASAAPAKP